MTAYSPATDEAELLDLDYDQNATSSAEGRFASWSDFVAPDDARRLSLCGHLLENLAGLSRYSKLEELYVSQNELEELSGLASAPRLRKLDVSFNLLDSLESLPESTALTELQLGHNELLDITGLERAPNLEILSLAGNGRLSDLSPVALLETLRELYLQQVVRAPLEPLAGLTKLERLNLTLNEGGSLQPLEGLPALRLMKVVSRSLSGLDPFRGLALLEELELTGCQPLTDASALAELPRLKRLALPFNSIADARFADKLPELIYLDLRGNPLPPNKLPEPRPGLEIRI